MSVETMPLRQWLKASQATNWLIVQLMSLRYDLDGALAAGQTSLAWLSQQKMLLNSTRLFLAECGVEIGWSEDSTDRDLQTVRTLERLNPALAHQVWDLWLRPEPAAEALRPEIDRAVEIMATQLGAGFLTSREEVVTRWAIDTKVLRTVAKDFGVAQADNWYVSDSTLSSADLDWYGEVLKTLEG
jgi:hypothetical protein